MLSWNLYNSWKWLRKSESQQEDLEIAKYIPMKGKKREMPILCVCTQEKEVPSIWKEKIYKKEPLLSCMHSQKERH